MNKRSLENIDFLKTWNSVSGYKDRKVSDTRGRVCLTEYELSCNDPEIAGKTLIFFSDLHWCKTNPYADDVLSLIKDNKPDWLVFGGDLVSYACFLKEGMDYLSQLSARIVKIAVYGNWDKRRRRWFSFHALETMYAEAGFDLLVNRSIISGGLYFYGCDDFKTGMPTFKKANKELFSITVSHNPDSIMDYADRDILKNTNLILCGHTHGGQVRIPLFGALKTSSCYWKSFEYGRYINSETGTEMLVTSGTGNTLVPLRMFCSPEVIRVKFTL